MAKSKKNPLAKAVKTETKKPKKKVQEDEVNDDFDFGGIPKGINLKKNIGCGG